MTINEAPLNKKLIVRSFSSQDNRDFNEIESRLMHLGFISGEFVRITKRAPFFQEPLLVDVRGRLIALSASEAKLVEVEVTE